MSRSTLKNRLEWISALLMAMGDLSVVIGVFMLGFWLRHAVLADFISRTLDKPNDFRLSALHYLASGAVMGVVTVIVLQAFGAYRRNWGLAQIEELAGIMKSSFTAVVITFALSFAVKELNFSRFVLLFSFPAASLCLAIWHNLFREIARRAALKAGLARRTAIYGCGSLALELSKHLEGRGTYPSTLCGFIRPKEASCDSAVEASSPGDLEAFLHGLSVDTLIIADTSLSRDETAEVIYICEHTGLSYMLVPDVFTLVSLTTRFTSLGGTTLIESVSPPLKGFRSTCKRLIDILISTAALPFLLIPFLLLSLLILADDGRPVFYVQTRLGRNNRPFRMIKFRSMRAGADDMKSGLLSSNETSGPIFKMKCDPRVTRAGRFLRRWSLDELPQILNVLRGDMSLIGPRPPLPEEVEAYTERHLKRLQTIPGMTGIWQISGRSQLGFEEMVKLDLYYVDNWSVWLDMSILLLTIPAALSRRGAY